MTQLFENVLINLFANGSIDMRVVWFIGGEGGRVFSVGVSVRVGGGVRCGTYFLLVIFVFFNDDKFIYTVHALYVHRTRLTPI